MALSFLLMQRRKNRIVNRFIPYYELHVTSLFCIKGVNDLS